ncbi:hypothetical protein FB451DRAFT_1252629 [Mycena latifolia]|nr:hypothetical protein FB451DRAFT_1252629 [Mycena latifolia]
MPTLGLRFSFCPSVLLLSRFSALLSAMARNVLEGTNWKTEKELRAARTSHLRLGYSFQGLIFHFWPHLSRHNQLLILLMLAAHRLRRRLGIRKMFGRVSILIFERNYPAERTVQIRELGKYGC